MARHVHKCLHLISVLCPALNARLFFLSFSSYPSACRNSLLRSYLRRFQPAGYGRLPRPALSYPPFSARRVPRTARLVVRSCTWENRRGRVEANPCLEPNPLHEKRLGSRDLGFQTLSPPCSGGRGGYAPSLEGRAEAAPGRKSTPCEDSGRATQSRAHAQ